MRRRAGQALAAAQSGSWDKSLDSGATAAARLVAIQTLAGYASNEATKASAGTAALTAHA